MITEKDYGKVAGIILVMAVMASPFQFSFLLWKYESRYADDFWRGLSPSIPTITIVIVGKDGDKIGPNIALE